MLEHLKNKLICELKDVSKDGVKTGNIEYLSKLAETYKNLNKAEKEEFETMIYDERISQRFDDRRYNNDYYGSHDGRGKDEFDIMRYQRGRYADGIRPINDSYNDYMGAKRKYRNGASNSHEMTSGLEMMMRYFAMLIEDIYKECESDEERRIMDKYIKRISDIH